MQMFAKKRLLQLIPFTTYQMPGNSTEKLSLFYDVDLLQEGEPLRSSDSPRRGRKHNPWGKGGKRLNSNDCPTPNKVRKALLRREDGG